MEYLYIDFNDFDASLVSNHYISERHTKNEYKKDLMWKKETLPVCPVARTIYETIFQVREALRPHGFKTLEAVAAVELGYRYMEEDEEETNEWIKKRGLTKQPKTREPTGILPTEIIEALENVNPPEHIGQMRYINETDVKGNIRKGVTRVLENWLDAVNEALYSPQDIMIPGEKYPRMSHPILMYLQNEFAPTNIRLTLKYDSYDKEMTEALMKAAKKDPERFVL